MEYKPVDLSQVHTYSLFERSHKIEHKNLLLPPKGASVNEFLNSLPNFLAADAFKKVVSEVISAHHRAKPVILAMGAHVIKVGCSPVIIDLIERNIVNGIACNGAFAIHDLELALFKQTSEDVATTIKDGKFGMVDETIKAFQEIFQHLPSCGLGAAVGKYLFEKDPNCSSILKTAYQYDIPATIHVALGTDTIHMSNINMNNLSEASMIDFRLLCDVVSKLGVWINIGSAVIMPEVFLKAITVARNLGSSVDSLFTANFDMIRHYRPNQNVLNRPILQGSGVEIIGHHEIMLPLLRQAILENLT